MPIAQDPPLRRVVEPRTVLVVDDDTIVARAIRRLLKQAGFDVTIAENGQAAVAAIAVRAFDVVVTDINMPGMTGVELLGTIRRYDLDVPVLLMTGAPTVETAIEAVALGALQYLSKPVAAETLVKAVERASQMHRMALMMRDALRLAGAVEEFSGDRAGLQARFESALDGMWMAFQPIVDHQRRCVFGYEALMRSREASLPHPGAVLAAAERLDRLPDLGRRVRALAAEAFEHAPPDVLLFVNLHPRDLLDASLFDPGAPLTRLADRVVLEITERAGLDDVIDVGERVTKLRSAGFRIALDDLGAGYAGLSSFVALQPEIVKLDMSLVRDAHTSEVRRKLIASMTSLCAEMGIQVVAEGIETTEERDAVASVACSLLQGYLFARPGPPFPETHWA